jgi:circadian clock protein KaiC
MLNRRGLVKTHQPRCLVLEPITALLKGGGATEAMAATQRLLSFAKAAGITIIMTNLLAGAEPEMESSRFPIATIADTWIHVSFVNLGGERNRALTVVKARGTKHSKQVRELILDENGIRLVDVYTAGGPVLMGTLRWEKEQSAAQEKEYQRTLTAQRRLELQATATELAVRLVALQQELEARQAELAQLSESASEQEEGWTQEKREVEWLRTAHEHDELSTLPTTGDDHELPRTEKFYAL